MASLNSFISGLDQAQASLNSNNPLTGSQQVPNEGFNVPATYSADGNGLPFTKAPTFQSAQLQRNIITWFIPQFGTVRMYINPEGITYNHRKLITKERTKGGFSLQYFGEELDELMITGTTGSSGIEGINMLYEIYRAEQFAFDSTGLVLSANNAAADITSNLVNGIGGALGNSVNSLFGGGANSTAAAAGAGILGGILGLDSPNNNLAIQNIPSLAQLAFTVELYYNGWVYRGYFNNMSVVESASDFLLHYTINFTATQRRGYRVNYFPWSRSPANGPSQYSTPYSFDGHVTNI